jgi:hypothetical protein
MSIDIYIFFSKMPPQCHMPSSMSNLSICNVSIDVWWFFSFKSHTTRQIVNYACQLTCNLIFAGFYMSIIKNLQKLCQKYALLGELRGWGVIGDNYLSTIYLTLLNLSIMKGSRLSHPSILFLNPILECHLERQMGMDLNDY